jgi:hypothetical protein
MSDNIKKHIFIGLGGQGVKTVSLIKQKIYEKLSNSPGKSKFEKMNETYRFLFLDTDSRDIDEANKNNADTYENGTRLFIDPQRDLVSLSMGNPHAIYQEAKQDPEPLINHRILEACSPELAAKIPDQPLKFGAGAFRMKSRISFARSLSDFQQKLQSHIEDLNSVKNNGGMENTIFYWVVCSANGGTGSGIINDVLYYVNMQHKRSIGDGDPHLVLVMYMPKRFIDKNSTEEKYSLNAYAVFEEIEAIKSMSMDERRNTLFHRLAMVKDYNLIDSEGRYDPFYYLIPIDCQTDNGTDIGDGMTSNTAEMLYYIHSGNGGDALHSDIDNYMHDLYNQRPNGFLVPMGYIALRKPEEEFRNYMKMRLERDLLVYGILNKEQCPEVKDEAKKALYEDLFKEVGPTRELAAKRDELVENVDVADDVIKLGDEMSPDHIVNSCVEDFQTQGIDEIFKRKKNVYITAIENRLYKKAETTIREEGLTYTLNLFNSLREYAKVQIEEQKKVHSEKKEKDEMDLANLRLLWDKKAGEKGLFESASNQKSEIRAYISEARNLISGEIDSIIKDREIDVLNEFCDQDGNGKLKGIVSLIEQIKNKAEEAAKEAEDKYSKKLPRSFGEKTLDVTSVYLPRLDQIADSNGWRSGNFFSELYEEIIKTSTVQAKGGDGFLPLRKSSKVGENTVVSYINEIYNPNSCVFKQIEAEGNICAFDNEKEVCFFANPKMPSTTEPGTRIERFVKYAKKILDYKLEHETSGKIHGQWFSKGVYDFFKDLNREDKEKIRRSLSPSLFFNYKGNRIAIDYREFLIFVTKDRDLARDMLGFNEGNPLHRFIQSDEQNAAFVIKAKYGLTFSDYRIYDSLKELYDKAPFREKYHFHKFFADHGENLVMEDLPYEVSPAHKVFAKILFLKQYEADFANFFYKSKYRSQQENFTNTILKIKTNKDGSYAGMFEIARPKAISMRDGRICIVVNERNTSYFSLFEGNDFGESFADYEKNFIRYSISETYNHFLMALYKFKGSDEQGPFSGENIINDKFTDYREKLLIDLDERISAAKTEKEKSTYKILFDVIENKIRNIKDLQ